MQRLPDSWFDDAFAHGSMFIEEGRYYREAASLHAPHAPALTECDYTATLRTRPRAVVRPQDGPQAMHHADIARFWWGPEPCTQPCPFEQTEWTAQAAVLRKHLLMPQLQPSFVGSSSFPIRA